MNVIAFRTIEPSFPLQQPYKPNRSMLNRLQLTANHLSHLTRQAFVSSVPKAVMSTFTLPNWSPEIPVHLPSDLTREQLLSFPAFKNWIGTLQNTLKTQSQTEHTFHASPYKLRKIDVQAVDHFGGGRIGFIKLKAEITNDNGEYLPGAVFLRGGSVAMLVCVLPLPNTTISPSREDLVCASGERTYDRAQLTHGAWGDS